MTNTQKRFYATLLVALGIVIAIHLGVLLRATHNGLDGHEERLFAGEVTHYSEGEIIIVNSRGVEQHYMLVAETKVIEGRKVKNFDDVHVGDVVMVRVSKELDGGNVADEIRIMTAGFPALFERGY